VYDPEWLARLAEEQMPEELWLPVAIRQCRQYSSESKAYSCFVSCDKVNQPGADGQFERNILLNDKKHGELVLGILTGNRVGCVEFPDRL
jgi:hypothetical protein